MEPVKELLAEIFTLTQEIDEFPNYVCEYEKSYGYLEVTVKKILPCKNDKGEETDRTYKCSLFQFEVEYENEDSDFDAKEIVFALETQKRVLEQFIEFYQKLDISE